MADDNTGSWMDFAQRSRDDGGLGLQRHQAAGVVGNLQNESGSGIPAWGPTGDNGTAWGSAQWRGDRLNALRDHAQSSGLDYRTPEAQQSFMRHEFDTSENASYRAIQAAQTPEDAATAMNTRYERSADRSGRREQSARSLYNGSDGPTAIDAAMGRTRSPTGSKMAFAPTDDEETTTAAPALSAAAQLGPGALGAGGMPVAQKPSWLDTLGQTLMNMAPGIAQDPAHAQALAGVAAAQQKGQGTWSTSFDPKTGKATQTNSATGNTRQFQYAVPTKDDKKWGIIGNDANGPIHGYEPSEEEYAAQAGARKAAADAAAAGPSLLGDASKEGPEYLKTVDPVSQQIIEGWHEGTGVMPSSFKMNDPKVQQLMASARKAYPDLDFTRIGERKIFANDAAKSSPSSIGGQITNSNTAAQNLNNLADKYIALKNSNGGVMPAIVGRGMNAVSNASADPARSALIQGLNTNADDASGEITKVLTGGPGGTHERGSRKERLGNPNYTPAEAAGVLEAEIGDLKGKHDQLITHTHDTMGQAYLDKHPEISKNFEDQHTLLRDKIEQLRGAAAAQASTKPTTGTFQNVPWSIK